MDKIKIIYIAGNGHSGSTLLDLILGSSAEAISVGELRQWNNYVEGRSSAKHQISNYVECTCGETFYNCPFWSKITKEIVLPRDRLKLLKRVAEVSGKNIIVDSSKNIDGMLETIDLYKKGDIDLQVIYLIRHFNGMVYSHQRIGYGFFEAAFQWIRYQWRLPRVLKSVPHIKIRYEDLAGKPNETLQEISKFTGLSLDNYAKDISETTYHNICGNLMRFKGFKEIQIDEAWKTEVPFVKRFFGNMVNSFGNLIVK